LSRKLGHAFVLLALRAILGINGCLNILLSLAALGQGFVEFFELGGPLGEFLGRIRGFDWRSAHLALGAFALGEALAALDSSRQVAALRIGLALLGVDRLQIAAELFQRPAAFGRLGFKLRQFFFDILFRAGFECFGLALLLVVQTLTCQLG